MYYFVIRDGYTVDHHGTPIFSGTTKYISENKWEFDYSKKCKENESIYFFGDPDYYEDQVFDECWPGKVHVGSSEAVYRYKAKELSDEEAEIINRVIYAYNELSI
jgi:hypothetical protein